MRADCAGLPQFAQTGRVFLYWPFRNLARHLQGLQVSVFQECAGIPEGSQSGGAAQDPESGRDGGHHEHGCHGCRRRSFTGDGSTEQNKADDGKEVGKIDVLNAGL